MSVALHEQKHQKPFHRLRIGLLCVRSTEVWAVVLNIWTGLIWELPLDAFIPELFALFMLQSEKKVAGSCDLEGRHHLVVKCEPAGRHQTWRDAQRGICQRFPLQLGEMELPGSSRSGEAGMKRNSLGMADMSAGFHGAVIAVLITWHLRLWEMPCTYSSMPYMQSARSLRDGSFLESSFGNELKCWHISRTNLIFLASLNASEQRILAFITQKHKSKQFHLYLHNSNCTMPSLFILESTVRASICS